MHPDRNSSPGSLEASNTWLVSQQFAPYRHQGKCMVVELGHSKAGWSMQIKKFIMSSIAFFKTSNFVIIHVKD